MTQEPGGIDDPRRGIEQRWALTALALALAGLLVLFGQEGRAAVQTWIDSTAYGHCFFVLPIALYLAWERRHVAAAIPVRPMPAAALLALPVGAAWLVAERLGIMEGQQLMAVASVELVFVAVLGWRLARAMAVPLLYLGFLVPFGAFLTPALQDFTAAFIHVGLIALGITNYSDGYIVQIPEGTFFVAEACAGLRFLIASVAFGVLYACMIYRSPGRRIGFIAASVVIPVVANGFRALGIVYLGHLLGSAQAAAVDHILYGWLFFSLVILLLILAGLPFREDALELPAPAPRAGGAAPIRRVALTAALAVGLVAIAPLFARALDARATLTADASLEPGPFSGCLPRGGATQREAGQAVWRFSCPVGAGAVDHVELSVAAVSARSNAGPLVRLRRAITGEAAAEDSDVRTLHQSAEVTWQVMTTTDPDRVIAYASWVDGAPAQGGLRQRVQQAWASLFDGTYAPMLVAISTPPEMVKLPRGPQAEPILRAIASVIDHNPGLPGQIRALSAALAERAR